MEDLRKFFHLPIVEVARQLGTCTTALKKICRKNKIQKWPYRQIRSITKSIQSLEMASLNDTLPEDLRIQYRQQIVTLQNAIDDLIKDPNGVIQLVNMGLSEEALQHLRDPGDQIEDDFDLPVNSSAGAVGAGGGSGGSAQSASKHASQGLQGSMTTHHSSSTHTTNYAKNYGLTASNHGGAQGVLNLLQWPKPSADVQQIMQAAAQLTTQSDTQAAVRRTAKIKRKSSEAGLDGAEDGVGVSSGGNGLLGGMGGGSVGVGGGMHEDISLGGEKHIEGLDVSQLEGGNLRHKKVEIGDTIADCAFMPESQKMVFSGPVHLAPLQRKKLKPNITRKVVPLMEPDIGSNFGIEFIPQFILNILHSAVGSSSVVTDAQRQLLQQQALAQQAQQAQQAQVQAQQAQQQLYDAGIDNIDESIHNYISDSANYPAVYGTSGMYGSGNSSATDLDMYANSYNNMNNSSTINSTSHDPINSIHAISNHSMYATHYTHEPSASQAAAHLVSLTNTQP